MAIRGTGLKSGQLVSHLLVRGVARAIRFYERALGAVELYRSPLTNGNGLHAQLRVGGSLLLLTDESPDSEEQVPGFGSPQSLGGTSVTLQLYVDDVDAAFKRAVDAGATPIMPPEDCFWGDRYSMVRDPFGHSWAIATVKGELTPKEVGDRKEGIRGPEAIATIMPGGILAMSRWVWACQFGTLMVRTEDGRELVILTSDEIDADRAGGVKSPLAVAYFPTPLPGQYRRRWGVSLPCSGWERVGPPRSNHQGTYLRFQYAPFLPI